MKKETALKLVNWISRNAFKWKLDSEWVLIEGVGRFKNLKFTPDINDDGEFELKVRYDEFQEEELLSSQTERKCYCGQPVDTSDADCDAYNLCKDHADDV